MSRPTDILPAGTKPARLYEPLVPVAVAMVAGILIGEYAGGGTAAWTGVALAAAGAWGVLRLRGATDRVLLAVLLVLMTAAGAARYRISIEPAADNVGQLLQGNKRLVALEGIVVRSASQTLPPDDVFLPSTPYYIRSALAMSCRRACVDGRWMPASGRVAVTIRQPLPDERRGVPELGDCVQVTGVLSAFGEPSNPGGFDFAAYRRRQGVSASFRTDHWEAVRTVQPAADPVLATLARMQKWAMARLETLPSPEGRAVVAAMLLGRRDWLDFEAGQVHGQDIERAFLATGTTHFLVVSGFNVGLLATAVMLLGRLLGLGRRTMAVAVALVVLGFTLLTELEPPIIRAAILFWIVCAGWFLGRPPLGLNSLAAAVVVVLALRPGDLFSTSFQLSFLAVLGMMYVAHRIEGSVLAGLHGPVDLSDPHQQPGFWYKHVVRGALMVSVAATLMSMPIIAYRFHLVAWLAPLASTLLLPLVWLLTVGGMALVAVGWMAPWLHDLLAALADGLGRTIAGVVTALARAPGAYAYVSNMTEGWVMVTYMLLVAWVWRSRLRIQWRRLALAALAAAVVYVWAGRHVPPEAARATFYSVGSGNCTLLELPNGRTILYDAGSALGNARAAESMIAPAIWSGRVDRIDALFVSHPHFDHFKDILPLVQRFGIQQVYVPPTFMRRRLKCDDKVIQALLERGVRVEFFGAGDRLAGTGGVEIAAIWPRGGTSQTKAINNGSLAVMVTDRTRRLLLPGDLEPSGLRALAALGADVRADVMLWPHHGHEPAAVGEFVRLVGAHAVVISAGRPYGTYAPPDWTKEQGVTLYHTGLSGSVAIELRPAGLYAETFRDGPSPLLDARDPAEDEMDPEADETLNL